MPQSVQCLRLASVLTRAKEPFHSLFFSFSFPTKMFILCHFFVFQYIKSPQSAYLSALYDGNAQATRGQTENKTRNKDLKTWLEIPRDVCIQEPEKGTWRMQMKKSLSCSSETAWLVLCDLLLFSTKHSFKRSLEKSLTFSKVVQNSHMTKIVHRRSRKHPTCKD